MRFFRRKPKYVDSPELEMPYAEIDMSLDEFDELMERDAHRFNPEDDLLVTSLRKVGADEKTIQAAITTVTPENFVPAERPFLGVPTPASSVGCFGSALGSTCQSSGDRIR